MIVNAINGVWFDTYIMQIMIQQELGRLTNYLETNQILKTFQSELKIFITWKKKNSIGISVFGYENKVKYPMYVSKICFEKNC